MLKRPFFYLIFFLLAILITSGFVFAKVEKDSDKDGLSDYEEKSVYLTNPNNSDTDSDGYKDNEEVFCGYSPLEDDGGKLTEVVLAVPYTNEAPDDNWTGPWKNACEEASITMAEKYYLGKKLIGMTEAKNFMWLLFEKQNYLFGSNADADALRTTKLINNYTSFGAVIKDKPTIDEIKTELQQKRPVISLHYGFNLKNKNIPFLATGSSYHMMIIIGYDDENKEFITNDPGDRVEGQNHRYSYDLFMKTLHDFDFKKMQAIGPARVIFTYPKLVKLANKSAVYFLSNSTTKQYVSSPSIFKQRGWSWDAINVVEKMWLDEFKNGEVIK
jgi:uncharacterized protein YvpB